MNIESLLFTVLCVCACLCVCVCVCVCVYIKKKIRSKNAVLLFDEE